MMINWKCTQLSTTEHLKRAYQSKRSFSVSSMVNLSKQSHRQLPPMTSWLATMSTINDEVFSSAYNLYMTWIQTNSTVCFIMTSTWQCSLSQQRSVANIIFHHPVRTVVRCGGWPVGMQSRVQSKLNRAKRKLLCPGQFDFHMECTCFPLDVVGSPLWFVSCMIGFVCTICKPTVISISKSVVLANMPW